MSPSPQLARKLRLTDYFTLGWGTMVGVGWLVVMDDWLGRGGSLGAILGFAIGGALLLPIGYVYAQLVMAMPDAAAEIAYTAKVFPAPLSFATGWMMVLAYFIVCPWEAVAIGRIAGYILPGLNSVPLYTIAARPVYLPHLLLGLAATAVITFLNYRGIGTSARFQNWTAFTTLALFVVFVSVGAASGSVGNFPPLFSGNGVFISIFLVIQIVPYFMTGFESVAKVAEEARPDLRSHEFFVAIMLAILVGIVFYTAVIAAVALAARWNTLRTTPLLTAVAFQQGIGSRWIVRIILAAALVSLVKVFNGNFVAASRLVFALGRGGWVDRRLSTIHPRNQTPSIAVVSTGVATAAAMFLGQALLIPVTEVGSVASATGWLAASAAYYAMRPTGGKRLISALGIVIALAMILMKIVPALPGHFNRYEWMALALWVLLGIILSAREKAVKRADRTR
ncbi:MAG: APC family permease [Acidobacteria bacterium]|nr:APC family permease [Acidobacteriota bacterium]